VQLEKQGQWERALESYRRACSLNTTSVLFLLARGHVCQQHGLAPEAEVCYRAALRLRPDDTVVLYNQAQLYAARGQLDQARANLARIVAAGVDSLGDRAAPVFCWLGDIALRREEYPAAAIHFRRALECDPGHRYAAAALDSIPRFAEFASPFQPDGRVPPKVAVYGYAGAVLLGLPSDDGIDVPAYPALGFDSLAELGQTLARFAGLAAFYGWPVDAVAALDPESQPLAIALAAALDARPALHVDAVPRGAAAVGVTAAGADPAALADHVAALRQRCRRSLYYAVGLTHPLWRYVPPVQVVTAPVRLEFPWNRGEASAAEHAEAFGAELAALLAAAPPNWAVESQAAWYTAHARLGFDLRTLEPRGSAAAEREPRRPARPAAGPALEPDSPGLRLFGLRP
jgi:hypothetical protein